MFIRSISNETVAVMNDYPFNQAINQDLVRPSGTGESFKTKASAYFLLLRIFILFKIGVCWKKKQRNLFGEGVKGSRKG